MYAKRMTVVSKSLGKSKVEVVLKVAGATLVEIPELPNANNVEKVVVDASTIEDNHIPLLVYRESAKQA